jgi:hypothetical protein
MSPHLRAWLSAFLFTQAVEVPIWAYALRRHRAGGPWPLWACAAAGFGASTITHPIVWFWFPAHVRDYTAMVIQAEVFAVVAEALYMDVLRLRWALAWSLAANAASAGLGLLSRWLFGWP